MPTARLLELLSHPVALDALDSLSKGSDPRGVLAGIAGDLITARVAEALGVQASAAPARARRETPAPRAERVRDDNVIDAEFKVINVTPRATRSKG